MKTILVTGGAGYIGSWVTKDLLEKGHNVRITVRDKSKTAKYEHLTKIAESSPGILDFWEANLTQEGSFDEAAEGCEAIIHIASPFILNVKDPQKDLVDPAVQGTRYVLNAATKSSTVKKVVLTSSVASINGDAQDMELQGLSEFTEEHWNTSSSLSHQPYSFSKVQAEKEAWKLAEAQNQWKLVVINPSFVLGPSLTPTSKSESLTLIGDFLKGKFKTGAPELYFGVVDVRDVAKAHIKALENDNAKGRHILAPRVLNFFEISQVIEKAFPGKYKLPKKLAPKWLLGLIGFMFGVSRKFVKQNVGFKVSYNNQKSVNELGMDYLPVETTMKEMVEQMHELKIV